MCNDMFSSFDELLENDGSVSTHHQNLQVLATVMLKTMKIMLTPIMSDIFNSFMTEAVII